MVAVRPRGTSKAAQPPIAGGKRSSTMNILGVTISERLSVSDHVSNILGTCFSSTFALRTLRSRVMPCQALCDVTRATTPARMLCASPAWWGLLNESDLNRLESFLRRARRGGFLADEAPTFKTMAARADSALFGAIISNQHHVLRSLCKECPTITYNLHPRSHPFEFPVSDIPNFLPRLMYQDIIIVAHLNLFALATPQRLTMNLQDT